MSDVTARKAGITKSASAAQNTRNATAFAQSADEGTTLVLDAGEYALQLLLAPRADFHVRGAGSAQTTLRYSSDAAKPVEQACGYLLGTIGLMTPANQSRDCSIEGVTIKDTNRASWPDQSVRPAAPNALYAVNVERFVARDIVVIDAKGNGGVTALGLMGQFGEFLAQDLLLDGITCYGTAYGNGLQGDGINVGGFARPVIQNCNGRGLIGRSFIEGGPCRQGLISRCTADMGGSGLACVGSFSVWESLRVEYCSFQDYSSAASCVALTPDDFGPGNVPPMSNIEIFACAMSSRFSGLAAVGVNAPRVRGLKVTHCRFETLLPFWFGVEPDDDTDLSNNAALWTGPFGGYLAADPLAPQHHIDVSGTRLYSLPQRESFILNDAWRANALGVESVEYL